MANQAQEILVEYIKKNQNSLYKLAFAYTKNQEQALDVVQEAITKALENINKLKHEEYVKTWFYRILINEALRHKKTLKRYIEFELLENELYNKSHEENLIQNLDIYQNIYKLDDKIKTVIILRFFENMKIEEIAFITKTNVSTIKSRLYKGIKELKEKMK